MNDKSQDPWGELPNKKGEIQSEAVLRQLTETEAHAPTLQVLDISKQAKTLNKTKTITVLKPEKDLRTSGLTPAQTAAYQDRLEIEASRLVRKVVSTAELKSAKNIITLTKDQEK